MDKIQIILLVLLAVMIFPLFGTLLKLSIKTPDGTIDSTLSLWQVCVKSNSTEICKNTDDREAKVEDTVSAFFVARLFLIIGFAVMLLSVGLLFCPPLKQNSYIILILGGIISLIAPIILITTVRYPSGRAVSFVEAASFDIASYVQIVGAVIAIVLGLYYN